MLNVLAHDLRTANDLEGQCLERPQDEGFSLTCPGGPKEEQLILQQEALQHDFQLQPGQRRTDAA